MEEKFSTDELGIMLSALNKKVDDGFSGIIKRLDISNGNIEKNSDWRLTSEGGLAVIKWLVGFIGVATMANIAVNLFK